MSDIIYSIVTIGLLCFLLIKTLEYIDRKVAMKEADKILNKHREEEEIFRKNINNWKNKRGD